MKIKTTKDLIAKINDMTIETKTSLLFLVMVTGMLFIGSFSHISLNRIMENYNIIYTKRMLPIASLEKLKDIYSVNVLDTLRDMERHLIVYKQGEDVISLAQELIRRDWRDYKSGLSDEKIDFFDRFINLFYNYKTPNATTPLDIDEESLIEKVDKKIDYIDNILTHIFALLKSHHEVQAYKILKTQLYPTVYSVNIDLTQLINLNLEASIQDKDKTHQVYKATFEWIVAGTIGTIIVAALIAIVILQNIRMLHDSLAQRVDQKTKELQALNHDLELKIDQGIEVCRQKDEIMIRQSRHAAMGEMIGNIAHQWRQPLNALSLVIQSFQTKQMLGQELSEEFVDKQVKEGLMLAGSMSKTIDDFRNFFNPNKHKSRFSIAQSIKKSIEIMGGYYKRHHINIILSVRDDFEIMGFPNEFSQVIVNLLSNSKDVLCEKEIENRLIEVLIYTEEEYGYVRVIDNGGGIKPEVIDRIFEPYFTTKHKSSGSGIGLYMSQQIIEKQMQGSIIAENISHTFTNFKAYEKCANIKICLPLKGGKGYGFKQS
ncbi:ATP-binding protein [Sulfurospirillum sp. 1612]|uniref:ATP-binding protein n=1 Tax=Sulfurospirillum sp. 1612 TaxID=3094835 RepID=UPI002F95B858